MQPGETSPASVLNMSESVCGGGCVLFQHLSLPSRVEYIEGWSRDLSQHYQHMLLYVNTMKCTSMQTVLVAARMLRKKKKICLHEVIIQAI